jgi:2,3-bisphosphoglycerate-dependent phosphoglycerate mutase
VSGLVLLRNGQSLADAREAFAGLLDPDLTVTGVEQAHTVADLLSSRHVAVDLVVTSPLARAVQTADAIVERLGTAPERLVSWRLAARDLGCLTGIAKQRAVRRFGTETMAQWRFATDGRPPPASPELARSWPWPPPSDVVARLPFGEGESLRQVEERTSPLWDRLRGKLAEGRTVLVVAHTDSLRALRRVVEGRAEDEADVLRVVPAQPLAYRTNPSGNVIPPAVYLEEQPAG